MKHPYEAIAGRIDHALLLPTLTPEDVRGGCVLADRYHVASVCVKPCDIELAVTELQRSSVKVGTVIGFPHGGQNTESKREESRIALASGAVELDMVINIGWARAQLWQLIQGEIEAITRIAHDSGAILKVIFENCYLEETQKIRLCEICGEAGVDYVKTSTGFGTSGAVDSDLILMRRHSPVGVKLKAAGGMRNLADAIRFIDLGCDRLGTSKTLDILEEYQRSNENEVGDVSRETSPTSKTPGMDY